MSQHLDDSRRQVAPRWRPFWVAARLGMLDGLGGAPRVLTPAAGELEQLVRDWRSHRSIVHAADLVDAALVLDNPGPAQEAATFLIKESEIGSLDSSLARLLLGDEPTAPPSTPPEIAPRERYKRIASARALLRRAPRNPLALVDVAREYAALGQWIKAEDSLMRAVFLAPNDRFVLRSASRFFLHTQRPEKAHRLLVRSARTVQDPWLLAAEIVAAEANGKRSRLIKTGMQIVSSGALQPSQTSELASAIGTIQHLDGNRRQMERLFDHALIEPTENTVAQASWLARHLSRFQVRGDDLDVPLAFEARAWDAALMEDYPRAVEMSWQWLRDEPFASRAALFGGWIASTAMGDFAGSRAIIQAARLANPDDPRLIVHEIYTSACLGDTARAEVLLQKALPDAMQRNPSLMDSTEARIITEADRGLIAFRRRNFEEGRARYRAAIDLAHRAGKEAHESLARMNLYREEVLANQELQVPLEDLGKLLKAFPPSARRIEQRFLERLVLNASGLADLRRIVQAARDDGNDE